VPVRANEIDNVDGRRTFAIIFDVGDELADGLLVFAREHRIRGAYFTAIGALEHVTLGFWNEERKEYRRIPIHEQVEVLSLVGNVALEPGGPKVHAHVVVGKADGTAHGGHLLQGHVRPTLEVILIEVPEQLRRTFDPRTGLALLNLGASPR
jgi:predicted DNA-binding protein with PD1-like motif